MKKQILITGGIVLAVIFVGVVIAVLLSNKNINMPENNQNIILNKTNNFEHIVTLETSMGNIKIETYDAYAPKTVENFITLANQGFYDGIIFHRVIDGFMIQGGCPEGTGVGGPGYTFEDELNPKAYAAQEGYSKRTVAMANAGPDTNGSQFFIMVADYPLPHYYTIFGRVIEGQEIANAISKVKTDNQDKPLENIVIKRAVVERR